MKVIGTNVDGLSSVVGEGIFGYGTPDGSLGHGAHTAPMSFGPWQRQGIFFKPFSYTGYEAMEPELQWALEKRPGLPRFPGSSAQGLVLVGPSMGSFITDHPTLSLVGAVLMAGALGYYLAKRGF
jgi:hypothetical protein